MLKSTKIVQTFAGPIEGKILQNPNPLVIPDWNSHLKTDAVQSLSGSLWYLHLDEIKDICRNRFKILENGTKAWIVHRILHFIHSDGKEILVYPIFSMVHYTHVKSQRLMNLMPSQLYTPNRILPS